jgi:hypothetical protein
MAFPKKFIWGAAAASYQIESSTQGNGHPLTERNSVCRQKCPYGESEHARRARCDSFARRDLRGGRRVTGGSTSMTLFIAERIF